MKITLFIIYALFGLLLWPILLAGQLFFDVIGYLGKPYVKYLIAAADRIDEIVSAQEQDGI
jgi:hypothetical protein